MVGGDSAGGNLAAAACIDIRRGYSRKLAVLAKHERISLGALYEELIEKEANDLTQVPTKRMEADLLTKPFSHTRHWVLISMIGLKRLRDLRPQRAPKTPTEEQEGQGSSSCGLRRP